MNKNIRWLVILACCVVTVIICCTILSNALIKASENLSAGISTGLSLGLDRVTITLTESGN